MINIMRATLLPIIAITILALTPIHTAKGTDTDSVFTKETNNNDNKNKKTEFSEGLKAVEQNGKWGFINKDKELVIPYEYDDAANFDNGHAFVKKDGQLGLIGKDGDITYDYDVMKDYVIPFSWADSQPKFKGKSINTFAKWVNSKLTYPEGARLKKLQGRVLLKFVIDTDGYPKDITVEYSPGDELSREAIRVVLTSPAWQPAKFNGKPYKVSVSFPVIFTLSSPAF